MASRFAVPVTQLVNDDASGIASGWLLNFYTTGTTTRKDTFSDNALTTANANPVVADSSGRFGDIFLESGTYKVVLTDADAVEKWTADPVAGSLGATGAVIAKTAAYTVVAGDATKLVNVDATSGALTVTLLDAATATDGFEVSVKKTDSSANAVTVDGNGSETIDGATTLVLSHQNDEATLRCDGSNWFIVAADHGGLGRSTFWKKGADIASASPLVLGTDGNFFDVTGTTGFSAITVAKGLPFMLQFDAAVAITVGAGITLNNAGNNYTTVAGDILVGWATAANTVLGFIIPASGTAVAPGTILQVVHADIAETSTATTTPAIDTSVPLISEGTEIVSQAITLRDTSSRLKITVSPFMVGTGGLQVVFAIFRDSTCVGAAVFGTSAATHYRAVNMVVVDSPASASALTYTVRFGVTGNTCHLNKATGGSLFGGAVNIANGLTLEEIAG